MNVAIKVGRNRVKAKGELNLPDSDISKADIFMNAFDGQLHTGNEMSPLVSKMSKKLKKYRMLTKVLSILSAVLLLLLIILLFSFMM